MNIIKYLPALFVFLFSGSEFLYSQNISKEIVVVNPYEPTLRDVQKFNIQPRVIDTVIIQPDFKYAILPTRVETSFELKPINPAKMVAMPASKLYKSYLKLGMGNYFTPFGSFSISNLRSKDYAIGAEVLHKSSLSKIKLDNDDKINANYSLNKAKVYGKKFFSNAELSGDLEFQSNSLHYYGYNTANFTDSFPTINNKENKQHFSRFSAGTMLNSTYSDSSHLNYKTSLNYTYFNDKFKNYEHVLFLTGDFSKAFRIFQMQLNTGYQMFNTGESMDSTHSGILEISPKISKSAAEWNFVLGLNTFYEHFKMNDKNAVLYIYPEAYLEITIIKNVLTPYFGITGFLEPNYYQKTAYENEYIVPGLQVKNAKHKLVGYAGLKGQFGRHSGFRADVTYSTIEDMHLFVNDTSSVLMNQFGVVYDDVEIIKYHGEIYFDIADKLNFLIKGNYYDYTTILEKYAWHKPEYDLTFSTNYNLRDKILVNFDITGNGKRYAKNFSDETNPYKLKAFVDLNLNVEYRYSKILSGFINLYNLSASRYEVWNYYPSQRLNVMLGFTYKL
ncbi:MAG: hypothetical protein JXJ22_12435 [Bacteroidales bacterium]|nr:hypothetical protein [Bacteroidales bacterium]